MQHELILLIEFGGGDLRPGDHLEVFAGLEEWENLDTERSEDDVGVASTVDCEAEEQNREGERDHGPPPRGDRILRHEVEEEQNKASHRADRPEDGEKRGLGPTREAQFLVRFGDGLGTHGG